MSDLINTIKDDNKDKTEAPPTPPGPGSDSGAPWRKLMPSLIFLLSMLAADVVYFYQKGLFLINSDSSAELILADMLNREGGILSGNWFYSSELRVVNTQLIYKLALRLSPGNWHNARTIAVAMFMIVLALSAYFLMWAAGNRSAGIWLAGLSISPIGAWYAWNVVYNSFYVPHIVLTFLPLGLLLLWLRKVGGPWRHLWAGLLIITAFASCLGGVRQIMICYGPLGLCALIVLLLRKDNSSKSFFILSLISGISAVAGLWVNGNILAEKYSFVNLAEIGWSRFEPVRFITVAGELMGLYGWQEGAGIISYAGIVNIISILFVIIMVICSVRLFKIRDDLSFAEEILALFPVCAFLVELFVYSQTNVYNESYWIPFMPLIYVPMLLYLRRMRCDGGPDPAVLIAIVILCSISTMREPYISMTPNDLGIMGAANFLIQNGYGKGYAKFWNSSILTELSSGGIEAWTVEEYEELEARPWLQSRDHAHRKPEGTCFILINTFEAHNGNFDGEKYRDHLAYEDGVHQIYVFDDIEDYLE